MPVARLDFRNHRLATILLAALFIVAMTNSLRSAWDRFDEMLYGGHYVSRDFSLDIATLRVDDLSAGSQSAGLRKGDRIVGVNGRPVSGESDIEGPVNRARTGDTLLLRVERAGSPDLNLRVPLVPFTYVGYEPGTPAYIATILSRILTPLFCLALGFWVAAVRIGDRSAWTLLVLMLSLANLITDSRTVYGHEDALQPFLTGITGLLIRLGPLALFYFGIVFPQRLPFDCKYPWVKWLILGPMLVRATIDGVGGGLLLHHYNLNSLLWPIVLAWGDAGLDVELALIGLYFAILAYRTVTASPGDERRRFLLLDTGSALGLLPFLATYTWLVVSEVPLRGWPALLTIPMLFLFPLTMTYVIVVHRAMDVRVALRQGVQYLLATGGILFLQFAISAAIVVLAATAGATLSVGGRAVLIAAGFALLVALGASAGRLRQWIDRRFFREAYEADQILADLASRVRTIVETGPLLETVANRMAEALHVPRIAILLDGDGTFRPAYSLGYATAPGAAFDDRSLTLRRLRRSPHSLVEFQDANSWVQLTDNEERAALEALQPELLLPLTLREKLLGIMSLGPKQSEEPFSPTDLRLLNLVAAQTGLALENGRLTEAIREEARAREKHSRELELGREVQERLFPQELPVIEGLEYAGACRPALGVGGDYYDFIPMPNGELGIAIGDVSGKGIPAALLMATLRAFLRGQTIDHASDLGAVIANLNRLVFESSAQNRYATFFLSVFDPATRILRYVNAGHNAPMVICPDDRVERLEVGGSVVGLMRDGAWDTGQIALGRGDLFVAFTDGISESMNAQDDEWGEDQVAEAARAIRHAPTKAILDQIVRSADEFAAGAPQYDDMTLIVARVS